MNMLSKAVIALMVCALPVAPMWAQQTTTPPVPLSQTTLTNGTVTPMTKDELKAQRKAQKEQEKADNANAKAAKSQAKAKKDQDKALQDQEKANGTVPKS